MHTIQKDTSQRLKTSNLKQKTQKKRWIKLSFLDQFGQREASFR